MEVQNAHHFDWAHDAYVVLNDSNSPQHAEKSSARQNNTLSIPPSLLTHVTIERFGQVTPPDEMSPADPPRNAREASIPVDQLRNEAIWHQQQTPQQYHPEPSQRRFRTGRQTAAGQTRPETAALPQHDDANPPPPKRKRGRPKSQPQMVDAVTADGFPFQVSSARQSHLEKNRVAAHKCRQRKKEYINGLEGRARDFSSKNKALKENVAMLREEVLGLKNEVLRHAGCGFWAVDEYLARCAGDLLGMEVPLQAPNGHSMTQKSPTMHTQQLTAQRHDSTVSMPSHMTDTSSPSMDDDFGGLELLRDYDDDNLNGEH